MHGTLLNICTGSLVILLLAGCTLRPAGDERPTPAPYAPKVAAASIAPVDLPAYKFTKIDAIVEEAIREMATPGAVVMVLKDGKTVFARAYGHHTYAGEVPTKTSDIFDLASLTKIFATTLATMRLVEEGKLDLGSTVGAYLDELKRSHPEKAAIVVRDLLTHEAGLVPFIPFYRQLKEGDVSTEPLLQYPVKVADRFYLRRNYYEDVMRKQMLNSPMQPRGKYVYSDIGMYLLQEILQRITGQPLDVYVDEQFYQPLGARSIGFRPLERFASERIVPTEEDGYFRKQLLKGYVQDPGAAMTGGVAGHAGLFASAGDLALLSQMLLNGGSMNGRQFIRPETVKLFTSRQSAENRRGLGFDCWDPEAKEGYPCTLASSAIFGHTGYTGTCVWIDPQHQLVYIFLSNRLYPSPDKAKLQKLKIRPRIQDAIYEAIGIDSKPATSAAQRGRLPVIAPGW